MVMISPNKTNVAKIVNIKPSVTEIQYCTFLNKKSENTAQLVTHCGSEQSLFFFGIKIEIWMVFLFL